MVGRLYTEKFSPIHFRVAFPDIDTEHESATLFPQNLPSLRVRAENFSVLFAAARNAVAEFYQRVITRPCRVGEMPGEF